MTARGRWVAWAVALGVLLAACGGGEDVDADDSATPVAPPSATQAPASEAPSSEPPEQSQQSQRQEPRRYTVQSGDTLFDIAREFDTTVEAIVEANDIEDPDVIDIGQELVIPRQ